MNNLFEVIYNIYKNDGITQREITKETSVSLGLVNKIIAEATEKGLLTDARPYTLSEQGIAYLEQFRVDNAIIMAAGFGSRFVPITYDTPKGLVVVLGERMIERQIKQLHEVGIKDITIVVGYLKEKFEYLTDKYDVKLIYNPDYAIKNNISSLYYAKNELKNTYILTSDIYMKDNLYREFEAYSYYVSEFFEDSEGEWALELNRSNLITKVNPYGGKNVWAMYGPAFFTTDFSHKLSTLIDSYYNIPSYSQWYWEDVYMKNIDTLDIYARKVSKGSVVEFESVEELRNFDSNYLISSGSEVLDTIAKVFNASQADIVDIRTLKEGMTNDSFVFGLKGDKYVFRVPGRGTEQLLNRYQERDVYDVIKSLNISDEIIHIDPKKGYKITKYLSDSRILDAKNSEEVKKAMNIIRSLHNNGLKVDHVFDIEERIEFYTELCQKNDAVLFNDYEDVNLLIKEILKVKKTYDRPLSLCHIDSIPANFLVQGDTISLMDWEYAGMADPFIDIAMFTIMEGLQDQEIDDLLEVYLERKPSFDEIQLVYIYTALAGFLWALWTQYKQSEGEDFGTYGIEQYRYARKYSRIVLGVVK